MDGAKSTISFFVNGKQVIIGNPDPETNLLHYLRRSLHLTGTKLGCGEGGCGACTVMLSQYNPHTNKIRHISANACLLPICSVDGLAVTTVEGIGSTLTKLHPCQERIARSHGSQCGFCTPGMVMSMYTLLRNNSQPTKLEMEEALHGNLCRCTGYRSILDGYRTFCKGCSCATKCSDQSDNKEKLPLLRDADKFIPLDSTQETIFPPQLKVDTSVSPLVIQGPRVQWYQPITLKQLFTLKNRFSSHTENRIVAGNTSMVLELRQKGTWCPILISVTHIPELQVLEMNERGLVVGAAVTVAQLEDKLKEIVNTLSVSKSQFYSALVDMLHWFAGPQIKNMATFGGNIMAASKTSDLVPILMAIQVSLQLISTDQRREMIIDQSFYINGKPNITDNEILVSLIIPFSIESDHIAVFKQSRRKHLDTAIVNACLWMRQDDTGAVKDCQLVYGGMSPLPIIATQTQEKIKGRHWNNELLSIVCQSLSEELVLPPNTEGGMVDYRMSLCLSFFYKFYLQVQSRLDPLKVSDREMSGTKNLYHVPVKGSQGFQSVSSTQPIWDTIGRPIMHLSALEQATGEAKYVDDLPHIEGEAYAGLVLSESAHATITVNTSALEGMEGVLAYVSAQDVPGSNTVGLNNDDYIFADGKVTSIGQIIGIVVAKSKTLAQRAARAVKVTYNNLPSVLTIEEAKSAGMFYQPENHLRCGDVESVTSSAEHLIEGTMRISGQEHFYMETCACLVIPKREQKEVEIIASTQNLMECQAFVSKALGIPANRVVAKVKRIGGGFGGKETRCVIPYAAVAVAANKVQSPVRIMLERHEDMRNTGIRHPFLGEYKVAFTSEGQLMALDVDVYLNGGASMDLSVAIMQTAMLRLQSVYYIPNIHIGGHTCQTNLPSNGAMRGFGMPQALMIMETIISHVADTLGVDKTIVQERNLLRDGEELVFGVIVEDCTIRRCWTTLLEKCDYHQRKKEVETFNKQNRWKKQGIAIVPTFHGMGIEFIPLNQAGALVHIYTDGSVLISHGGIEMGQGLHTKMIQVGSRCLNIPVEKIHISETNTDKVPNATATAASISSDLYGMAVKNACEQLIERLQPFKEAAPDAGWEGWVIQAYLARVNLSAQGFYKIPNIWMDWETGKGKPNNYYSYGVGCSLVEVDTLTGNIQVLRTDLLMDVGNSLNPAIDIGQIEGAFTQGLGLFTMEECIFLKDGKLYTQGPHTYKIPGCSDIPIELNVTLLDRCPNPKAIFSSKGIGEPPLFLAASVFFAIKEAVKSARAEKGLDGYFEFWSPASAERIRMACQDQFTDMIESKKVIMAADSSQVSWNIIP